MPPYFGANLQCWSHQKGEAWSRIRLILDCMLTRAEFLKHSVPRCLRSTPYLALISFYFSFDI